MEHFFPRFQVKTKKKMVFARNGTLFSPNSSIDLCSDAHQSQIIGGIADEDHTQIVGGHTVNLLGVYIPHPIRVSAPLSVSIFFCADLLIQLKTSFGLFSRLI